MSYIFSKSSAADLLYVVKDLKALDFEQFLLLSQCLLQLRQHASIGGKGLTCLSVLVFDRKKQETRRIYFRISLFFTINFILYGLYLHVYKRADTAPYIAHLI